jgi:hypothetical protein
MRKIFLWFRRSNIPPRLKKYILTFDYVMFQLRTAAFKAYCAILVRFQLSPPGVSSRVTTREHPAAEGGTVGEKGNFA